MTNIQDDQLNVNNNSNVAVDNNNQQTEQVASSSDQASKEAPVKADVEGLLSQLEALNKEITAKTVVDQTQLEDKKEETEKLEAPATQPALESSDEAQLPANTEEPSQVQETSQAQKTTEENNKSRTDLDLDKFINELETKIAQKNDEPNQEPKADQNSEVANSVDLGQDSMVKPTPMPTITPDPNLTSVNEVEDSVVEKENPVAVEENFSQVRPSLDLSGVSEQATPSLTLNNGQLEEKTQTPVDNAPISQPKTETEETKVDDESLEAQNLFTMLALDTISEEEKQGFLKDLEQLIWDNFVEVELPLLLNNEEKNQADQILADSSKTEDERKEALLVYLDKFVPNLEDMMYKKALTLKKEMFEERLKKLRENATEANNLSLIADLDQIQELVQAGRYKTAVNLLNKA